MMSEEAAFHRAIFARPDDALPVLIYADWLDERGDPRGPYLRRFPEIYRVISRLRTIPDIYAQQYDLAGPSLADREQFVYGLALALHAHRFDENFNPQVLEVVTITLDRLARFLPPIDGLDRHALQRGRVQVEQVLDRLLTRPPLPSEQRMVASRWAAVQEPGILLDVLERYGEDHRLIELFACLTQEMTLRGMAVDGNAVAQRLIERLGRMGHPLAKLPLRLLSLEIRASAYMTSYGSAGSGRSIPFYEDRRGVDPSPNARVAVELGAASELTDASAIPLIGTAVRPWAKIEARVFRLDRTVSSGETPIALVRRLVLGCLGELSGAEGSVTVATPELAFNHLFSAAHGGAYCVDAGGAYARLRAWQSLAGMVGLTTADSTQTVAKVAAECRWMEFVSDHSWFYRIAWDIGLVCLRPDGRTLAVLAATDTD